jgi:hypothetical protein
MPLVFLAAIPGGKETETTIHRRFAHLRRGGEWFTLNAALREFIDHARQAHEPTVTTTIENGEKS